MLSAAGIDELLEAPLCAVQPLNVTDNIAEAATRNVELVKAGAKVTAKETRASGIRWNFDPVLDIARQPLWARFPETFGEDPFTPPTTSSSRHADATVSIAPQSRR